MPFEAVKQRVVIDPPTNPDAIAVPVPAESSFWALPAEEQQRLMNDLETYHRELPRLLEEGHAGMFAVIRNGQVVGIWDRQDAALEAASERFGPAPVAIYPVKPQDLQRLAQLHATKESPCPS
jgi:hypothetical protein